MTPELADRRGRIAAALIEKVGSRGFRRTSVSDIAAAAGVGEEEFHRHFTDMEEAFVAVWDELTAEHGVQMAAAYETNPEWRERMHAMASLTLDFLRVDRNRAHFLVLEVLNAGELAQAHRDLAIAAQAALIDEGRRLLDDPDSVSPALAQHAAGAINEMLIRKTRSGELFTGDRAVRELMYIAVRPYLGHRVARRELTGRHETAREELTIPPPPEGGEEGG